ncbi:MAG: phosphoribosylaminoimidazolesuccinocarboxamide synthase [Pseudomonadota bacterium]
MIKSLKLTRRGKVRDIYDLGSELLLVATDRISCFDVVLPTPIPEKGKILTEISNFWFEKTKHIVSNHLSEKTLADVISDPDDLARLEGRTTICKKTKPLPVEAIVRGYISGSAWLEYSKHGTVCGQEMPKVLTNSAKFAEPIFTPSTKSDKHDENISYDKMVGILGAKLSEKVRNISLKIYKEAAAYALSKGIIIADTKFEFGLLNDKLILIDEVLTPDSSRFWPADKYEPGKSQPSFDKQFVRDYLLSINFNKQPPAPELPANIVEQTAAKYKEARQKLIY